MMCILFASRETLGNAKRDFKRGDISHISKENIEQVPMSQQHKLELTVEDCIKD
jgi:hypothetical protein